MSRRARLSRRLAMTASVLGLLIAGVAPLTPDHPIVSAQAGPALIVDDAQTANPELVEVAVADPAGFGVSGRTLWVPPGYTVSVVAAGLGGPRFMAFDDEENLIFGPDGMLYLAVGSSCNICLEEQPIRATIARANPDGSDLEIIATGLRNPVGLDFQPETGLLWATVNERDNQGNEIPPDLVTIVEEGANYGWPACMPPDATPREPGADCSGVTPQTIGIQAHSAPLGLAFLEGEGIPDDLDGDLIVVQHGSWNREPPAAPKLLLIDFEDGMPVAARDFATGWQDASGERWGRPAGVVVAPDGSLIISDDENGMLYRISAED